MAKPVKERARKGQVKVEKCKPSGRNEEPHRRDRVHPVVQDCGRNEKQQGRQTKNCTDYATGVVSPITGRFGLFMHGELGRPTGSMADAAPHRSEKRWPTRRLYNQNPRGMKKEGVPEGPLRPCCVGGHIAPRRPRLQLAAARRAHPTAQSDVQLHVENFKPHRFGERAIVKGLKLAFFLAVLSPERIPFFAVLRRWNVDLPVDVFARLATMRAPNRLNGLIAAEGLAALDTCPRAFAQWSMSTNGTHARRRPERSGKRRATKDHCDTPAAGIESEGVRRMDAAALRACAVVRRCVMNRARSKYDR